MVAVHFSMQVNMQNEYPGSTSQQFDDLLTAALKHDTTRNSWRWEAIKLEVVV